MGWAIFIASLWIYWNDPNHARLTNEDGWMVLWLGLILLFTILTTFIPFMRCLGQGYLYNYNAAFPASLLVAMIWGGLKHDIVVEFVLYGTVLISSLGISFYFWRFALPSSEQKYRSD